MWLVVCVVVTYLAVTLDCLRRPSSIHSATSSFGSLQNMHSVNFELVARFTEHPCCQTLMCGRRNYPIGKSQVDSTFGISISRDMVGLLHLRCTKNPQHFSAFQKSLQYEFKFFLQCINSH